MGFIRVMRDPALLRNRMLQTWRSFFMPGDLMALFITIVLLAMPALSLRAAEWPLEMRTVIPVAILSILFGFILARSQYNELLALIVSGLYGIVTVLFVAAFNEEGNIFEGLAIVLGRTIQWIMDATTGGINQDGLVFTLLVATLFWYLGYNAAWHVFRIDRVWRVILPPSLILVTNMVVYTGEANLDIYLILFMLMSLVLIVRSNLDAREWDWYVNGIRVPRQLRTQFLRVGVVLSMVTMLAAWSIPMGDLQERLDDFQEFMRSDPLRQVSEFWNRLIAPIEAEGPATADYYGGDTLNLGGAIQLGDQVILLVDAPTDYRYYWRSRVFEVYNGRGWSSSAELRVPYLREPVDIITDNEVMGASRVTVDQTFTIGTGGSRLVYTAPQPSRISVPARIDLLRTRDSEDANSPVNVSVIRPVRVLERGTSYQAQSQLSVATAFELRAAGTEYPDWVENPNAMAGVGANGRIINLAREIVSNAGAANPYDQAKAIETWLRTNITYNERIPSPPSSVDPMEWFLFEIRQGYCTYYATAMVLMLRGLGIPARMAAGFSEGEWDPSVNQYIVRERDAHTWVEVYFPGYGWVEFEPTSAQQPLNRDGDTPETQAEEPIAPLPTAIPTDTPTPMPSPTAAATDTPPPPDENIPPEDPPTPTVTPTPSPTPTVTPFIVPTVPPPVEPPPPQTSFLSFLLPAIGAALLLLLFVLLLVLLGVFTWWWWEWRGLRGMSPIARAYARLERYIPLIGMRVDERQTPEERRVEIVKQIPAAERPVTSITRNYTHERYSAPRQSAAADQRAESVEKGAWPEARGRILRRWLKRFIPFLKE